MSGEAISELLLSVLRPLRTSRTDSHIPKAYPLFVLLEETQYTLSKNYSMLRFFRRIREKLLEEGKFRSYFLYGLGEILLVVLGILIAFQIDNLNEERIKRGQELKILTQIKSDLEVNQTRIEELLTNIQLAESAADSILRSIDKESKVPAFGVYVSIIHKRFFFSPAISGYSQIGGFLGTLIRDDQLRGDIVELYEGDFIDVQKRQDMLNNHLDRDLNPQTNELFTITQNLELNLNDFDIGGLDFYKEISWSSLLDNYKYENTILTQKRMYVIQVDQLVATSKNIDVVLAQLEEEILILSK